MSDSRSIVLTGFMGTGKSTIGALLARQLDRVFVDMDSTIQQRVGLTIPHVFADYGESHFRAIERGLCHEIALQRNLVVATGGGAIVDDDSRNALVTHTFVICLYADPDSIAQRLQLTDDRPLANQWRTLLKQRQPIYDMLPNPIDTTDKSPETITQEIIALWQTPSP